MTIDATVSRARFDREKAAREEAERLLESKSRELYEANRKLEEHASTLSAIVEEQTKELKHALELANRSLHATQEAKLKLIESEEKFRSIIEAANDIVYMLRLDGSFDYVSPKLEVSLGHSISELLGAHFSKIVHPNDVRLVDNFLNSVATHRRPASGLEFRMLHADGSYVWHDTNASPIVDSDGTPRMLLGISRNIEAKKQIEAELVHRAHYDELTGLANRFSIIEQLKREVQVAQVSQRMLAVMFIDLDGFKNVNDSYGHEAGDNILKSFAANLKAATREKSDHVGRLAGDEFLVILPNIADRQSAEQTAKRIQELIRTPIQVAGHSIVIECSLGISIFPADAADIDTLISNADTAMYRHKADKRGLSAVFHS